MNRQLDTLTRAVRREKVDGWLFYGFHHRDPLCDELLGLPTERVVSRRWFYLLPGESVNAVKICHAIEAGALSELPGHLRLYSSQEELKRELRRFTGLRLAVQYSPDLPVFSYLDHGAALMLKECGIELVPSGNLIQQVKGVLSAEDIASHCRAADHLYEIVELCGRMMSTTLRQGRELYEGDVQRLILEEFGERGLETDHPPIVAAGARSADPHYAPQGRGDLIEENRIIQLDLWAREARRAGHEGIYADISWVFFSGARIPVEAERVFRTVAEARDELLGFLNRELPLRTVTGYETDRVSRRIIEERGYGEFLIHRTGHGIDTLPHGYGVNLDSVEFPDHRPFMEGSCFSIEPGIYLNEFGMRSEINAYIRDNRAIISGGEIQTAIIPLV